jgi:hypothetical protein
MKNYLVLYFDVVGGVKHIPVDSDEEAIETAQKLQALRTCLQVHIFEKTHSWETEWVKK